MSNIISLPLDSVDIGTFRELQVQYPSATMRIESDLENDKSGLSEAGFWQLISLLNWDCEGNDEAVIEPAVQALSAGPVRHIFGFKDLLSEKLYALDRKVFAEQIGDDAFQPGEYFSPDIFLYARCCVVANGEEAYRKVLENPELMPKNLEFAPLLRIASLAYERKTGRNFEYTAACPIETYSNGEGWKN